MFQMKVIGLALLLVLSVEAGLRKSGGGSSSRGGSSNRGSSSGSKYSSSANYPKQQQPLQKSAAPYPVQNSGYYPQASAPQLPSNPAYRPGVAPAYPSQQRPAYPQYQQPNYGAAAPAPHPPYAAAPHPPYAAAPSHFQQPGYGGQQHYPQQQPGYGGHHPPAGAQPQPVPQVVNNYYGGAGGGVGAGTGGVPVVQKSRSGPGIGTSLLAGAASGVAGAALYNALTPSRHGSTTIVREVDRPVDRVIEVDRQSAPRQDNQPQQPNFNNQPIMPQPGYVDPAQSGAFARKSDQGQPVYCDELPPMAPLAPMAPMPPAESPPNLEASNQTDITVTSEPVTNMPIPPPLAPGYNAALGCIVRTPYGPDNAYPPPPYAQNGYYGQEGFQNTNQLNQAGYAPDDRSPYVGGQQGGNRNGRVSKATNSRVPFLEVVVLFIAAWGLNIARF